MRKKIYKGYEINVDKVSGYAATIFDSEGESLLDGESLMLMDTKEDAFDDAEEFIDSLEEAPEPQDVISTVFSPTA